MDASSELSDLEDTQATQLLEDLLVPGSSPMKSPHPTARLDKAAFQSDLSESFQSSRNSNSLPAYNLHGLGTNQTQNAPGEAGDDEEEALEGSQKENIQGAGPPKDDRTTPGPFRQGAGREPPSRTNVRTPSRQDKGASSLAYSKTRAPNAKPLPVASLHTHMDRGQGRASSSSPSKVDATNAPGRTTRNSRTTSTRPVPAEDSFANDPEFDLDKPPITLNQNQIFDLPLSQLADSPEIPGLTMVRQAPGSRPAVDTSRPPARTGKVLVESTPTNSVSSQGDSSGEDSQHEDVQDPVKTQVTGHARSVSQESDDYGKSLRHSRYQPTPEPTQLYEPTQQATQPDAQQATQIATQVDEAQYPSYPSNPSGPSFPQTATNFGQSVPQSNQTTNSLLRGLPIEKQHRYAKYRNSTAVPAIQQPPPIAQLQSHTIPSLAPDLSSPDRQQFSSRPQPSPSKAKTLTHIRSQSPDALEVVPDSDAVQSSPIRPSNPPAIKAYGKAVGNSAKPSPALSKKSGTDAEEERSEEEGSDIPQRKRKKTSSKSRSRKLVSPSPSPTSSESEAPPQKKRAVAPVEEEEEEGSEDDVPLSAAKPVNKAPVAVPVAKGKAKAKGKGKATQPKAKVKAPTKQASTSKSKATGNHKGSITTRSYDDSIVPSSMPEQDFPQAKPKTSQRQSKKQPVASTSARQLTPGEDSDVASGDREEDKGSDDELDIIPQNNKRKRGPSKVVAVKREKRSKAATPPKKVLRSGVASAKKNTSATRVFALWSQDRYYYPGTVAYALDGGSQFQIDFDDTTAKPLPIEDLRLLDFHEGDIVELASGKSKKGAKYEVTSTGCAAEAPINLRQDTQSFQVPVKQIRIPSSIVNNDWGDRFLTAEAIVPRCQPGANVKPGKQKAVTQKVKSATKDGGGIFSGMGFLLSSLTRLEKEPLIKGFKAAGGFEADYAHVFPVERTILKADRSWHAERGTLQESTNNHIYLIAPEASKRPKYLTALALGIPCVSLSWMEDALGGGELAEWHRYLLPHGQSEHLGRTVSQVVDLNWGDPHLDDIMDNPVPFKLLRGSSILMLGKYWFTRDAPVINDAVRFVMAMGADYVDGAYGLHDAPKNVSVYTFIITYSAEEGATFDIAARQKRDWPWLMDCMLSNRLIDLSDAEAQSQEI